MKKYINENNQNVSKLRKVVKYVPFIFPFLLNNYLVSELLDLEQGNNRLFGHFDMKMIMAPLMIAVYCL